MALTHGLGTAAVTLEGNTMMDLHNEATEAQTIVGLRKRATATERKSGNENADEIESAMTGMETITEIETETITNLKDRLVQEKDEFGGAKGVVKSEFSSSRCLGYA
ncbi:hypothetical protein HHX47_DHR12000011 [Lentinula edodes]|nr:hypothetical protein HHX47_DHR12000011 [Lentinula edodes]